MKEIKLYVCETCGTQYSEKKKCDECEKLHESKIPKKIIKAKYLPIAQDRTGHPINITIEFNDGTKVEYRKMKGYQ